jgi:hypothetical protein
MANFGVIGNIKKVGLLKSPIWITEDGVFCDSEL